MLTWSAVLGFATASFLITICPGPSWIYAITSAVRQNMTAGFVAVLGNGTGILCHITAAASGLAALLAVSPRLYATLQWAGVSYLAWLGFKMLWKGPAPLIASQAGRRRTLWQVYRGGMLVNVLNPKVSVLMLALMPQFVDPARGSTTVQTLLLGATHWVIATTVLAILVILASRGASTFRPTPLFSSATRWGAGIALLLFSLSLALSSH
ncbi:MAG: LysE family translocator [Planctomycetaceae bacterium]|nr:LysE family translocator [Planctomycetaceae bacterium]